jgi:hypothetical protein
VGADDELEEEVEPVVDAVEDEVSGLIADAIRFSC